MSVIDIKFEDIFKIAATSMRINGSHPTIYRGKLWFAHFSFVVTINTICLSFLINSVFSHDIIGGHFTEACKNFSMTIICTNTSIKYFVLLYRRQSIVKLIAMLNDDYEVAKQYSAKDQSVVKRYAKEGRLVCIFWIVCAATASAVFPLKAFYLTIHSFWIGENELKPMFDLTYPNIIEQYKDGLPMYCALFALCFVFAFFAAIMCMGFDPLIPIFTLHTCGQLDLLSERIGIALSGHQTTQEMEENLKKIIVKLQHLYSLINEVQINFTVLNEFNMKSTTIMLPLVGFHMTEDIRDNVVNIEFVVLFFGATLHFLMPCYYSDLLMERSSLFTRAIYSCGWEKHPNKSVRQTVLFMLTRANKPLGISTVFYSINLDTFATMVRQAYAFFNLMNAAWGK